MKPASIAAVLLLSVFPVSILACTSGNGSYAGSMHTPTVTATAEPLVVPANFNWSGIWDTEWGIMYLVQTGVNVSGIYGRNDGRIIGIASGGGITGTWSEWPSYAEPDHAGDIWLELAGDCITLTGHWRWGTGDDWYGSWSGKWLSPFTTTPITIWSVGPFSAYRTEPGIAQE